MHQLYVIQRGLVLHRHTILGTGRTWGQDDAILPDSLLKYARRERARASTVARSCTLLGLCTSLL
jgi:hypothetical protein